MLKAGFSAPDAQCAEEASVPRRPDGPRVFLDYPTLLKTIGIVLSQTTLRRWEKAERFPKRVRLNGKTVAWAADEVYAWCDARRASR